MGITKLLHINVESNNGHSHLQSALAYIMKPEKTENGLLIEGGNCLFSTPEIVHECFMQTKKYHNKLSGRQAYHYIISLDKGEGNKDVMMDIMHRFCKKYLGDKYEYVYAVHTDKEHIHGHVIFNSVSCTDGQKYHYKQGDWERYIQPITNELCKEHGLSTIELGREFDYHVGDWKAAMRADIDECRQSASDYLDFIRRLKVLGYIVNDGPKRKYLTLIPPGKTVEKGFKGHRTNQLGEDYSKAALIDYFGKRKGGPEQNIPLDDLIREKEEKNIKWENITYSKYEVFYLPTIKMRQMFVDYKKQRKIQRSEYDKKAYLYKKDVMQLQKKMERQSYFLDHDIHTIYDVRERYNDVSEQYRLARNSYVKIQQEIESHADEYKLYEDYRVYQELENMYQMNADQSLYEYHKKYMEVMNQIEASPYSIEDFEKLDRLKKMRNRCCLDKGALKRERDFLLEIIKNETSQNMDIDVSVEKER